jgi:hypothetical protein
LLELPELDPLLLEPELLDPLELLDDEPPVVLAPPDELAAGVCDELEPHPATTRPVAAALIIRTTNDFRNMTPPWMDNPTEVRSALDLRRGSPPGQCRGRLR